MRRPAKAKLPVSDDNPEGVGEDSVPDPTTNDVDQSQPTPTPVLGQTPSVNRRVHRTWKVALSLWIVTAVLAPRASAAFPEITGRQILTQFPRPSFPFLIKNVITAVYVAESGFIEGLSDSVWPNYPTWPPWCLRGLRYGAIARQTGFIILLKRKYGAYRLQNPS